MRLNKQKGPLPTMLFAIGLFIHLVFIGGTLPFVVSTLTRMISMKITLDTFFEIFQFAVGIVAFVWSIPLIIGSFFVSAFPRIGITKDGIEFHSYLIFRSRVKWSEVNSILELPRGFKAITIVRSGSPLFNGLYSNKIYGDIVNSKLPVILISPQMENIDMFLMELRTHLKSSSTL
jgi:hypothetical protein